MNLRFVTAFMFLFAAYIAFGDAIQTSIVSSPENVVGNVGRSIGHAVSGTVSTISNLFWG
jgi:hypothetical protein